MLGIVAWDCSVSTLWGTDHCGLFGTRLEPSLQVLMYTAAHENIVGDIHT